MPVFLDVVSYSVVEIDRRFRDAYCLLIQGDDGSDDGVSSSSENL
jgi:hypothetical protein